MKKTFALILAVAMLATLLCACGGDKKAEPTEAAVVTTTVKAEYDDGVAEKFAQKTTKDENGNNVYEFTEDQYNDYAYQHKNIVSSDIKDFIAGNHPKGYGEFVTIDEKKHAVLIGIHEGEYDEEIAKEEAPKAAEYGFKFFQNLQTPVSSIRVIYIDANDISHNTEFGSFEFTL